MTYSVSKKRPTERFQREKQVQTLKVEFWCQWLNTFISWIPFCPHFPSGHVWMWELDCEKSWAPKNWCFWTVVLEKTLESPLDCKETQPVHSEDQSWYFFGRNDAKAEAPVLWPPHAKSWVTGKDSDAGKDWGQEEKGTTEDEMAVWHHWLMNASLSELRKMVMNREARRAVIHGVAESRTQLSDWTELNQHL